MAVDSMAVEKFRHLDLADEIALRVCKLLPGSEDDPVHCDILHTTLQDAPDYEAISYTWGSLTTIGEVLCTVIAEDSCNRRPLDATQNLLSVLRQLRFKHEARMIWIDQICINQKNLTERGQQVAIMRDIYHRSFRTIVWLGEGDDETKAVMNLIPRILATAGKVTHGGDPFITEWPSLGLPPITDPVWVALGKLMKRPWFHRTWTVQEAAVCDTVVVKCGEDEQSWDIWAQLIQSAMRRLLTIPENLTPDRSGSSIPHKTTAFGQVALIQGIRSILRTNDPTAVVDVLTLFSHGRRLRAKDPRDKVFALLRVTSPQFQAFMGAPDYKKSVSEIYQRAAIGILVSSDSLDFLCSAGLSDQVEELPSWVPDWSVPVFYPNLGRYQCFAACGDGDGLRGSAETREQDSALQVQGKILDSLCHLGHTFRPDGGEFGVTDDLTQHFVSRMRIQYREVQRCVDTARQRKSYPNGQDPITVCKQVLVAGVRLQEVHQIGSPIWTRLTPEQAEADFECYCEYAKIAVKLDEYPEDRVPIDKAKFSVSSLFLEAFDLTTSRRVFGLTEKGYMGLFPDKSICTDRVAIILGCPVPFVLRKAGDEWRLVGECYVHGLMDGEAMHMQDAPVQGIWLL